MTQEIDEDALRQSFLDATIDEEDQVFIAQQSVKEVVKEANLQTGGRDLTGLMIASLFSTLLVFFAPIASLISRKHVEKKNR